MTPVPHPATPGEPAPGRAIALADVIKSERPGRMYGRKPGCKCRDCRLWDAEKLLRELAAAAAGRDPADRLLTGKPGQGRRDGATVDLAEYADNPEYAAMIDARRGAADGEFREATDEEAKAFLMDAQRNTLALREDIPLSMTDALSTLSLADALKASLRRDATDGGQPA
jgi:hypothetical protein